MVAARTALSRAAAFTGVRPMDITRDLAGVAEVLAGHQATAPAQ